jgi:hypothetical protein
MNRAADQSRWRDRALDEAAPSPHPSVRWRSHPAEAPGPGSRIGADVGVTLRGGSVTSTIGSAVCSTPLITSSDRPDDRIGVPRSAGRHLATTCPLIHHGVGDLGDRLDDVVDGTR